MRIIRGKFGKRRFDVPKNITARPTTDFARENIFNVLENMLDFEGLTALDLFAGTGAISFEFVSRECSEVTAVEMANTQANFIKSVKQKLSADNLRVIKGDVFKFVETCSNKFDIIFADPPYDHPRFGEIPSLILNSQMIKPGTLVIVEHSRDYDFSELPHFSEQRTYGSVNFSLFQIPE
ncbi:MAG: 16S rRNA (guanine(966)-N(2))-methyltransferase RsmD [Muribaculaceae bacterium]|jgi:16S rRNA (guanine(966)-N(2))-methyltransferase RsmD|nr:16S rRNA (guanine(966)-N(2))-methyltransferase RsmD [Muribaculaceae bacterium]MBO7165758.1 16S rRNA (guanine(966)-N(2))-methyltransferase RsmD [Muribaculaceae bacterium]MBQ2370456.1 16S rRNA (guanine(966)-N(2))-methyltransferase RsmD [Muribaculaceae bacterium]MBQ2398674.1 16S rRNA (guanine(966)-N(2))-methyltransferase RsmD [Muribaculaceae bacterium]MBQ2440055.1 16S rRNA (guanine(966)-N(2))-methyltransferase RsmD [Muribaculaceae bacterium]